MIPELKEQKNDLYPTKFAQRRTWWNVLESRWKSAFRETNLRAPTEIEQESAVNYR